MPSLPDKTITSVQETKSWDSLSTASLIVSMYLKFLMPKLLSVSISDSIPLVNSSSNETLYDCNHKTIKNDVREKSERESVCTSTKQSWKTFHSQENALFCCCWLTCSLIISSDCGHVSL